MCAPRTRRGRDNSAAAIAATSPAQGPAAFTKTWASALAGAVRAVQIQNPVSVFAERANASRARADDGAESGGVAGDLDGEPGIVRPAVRIFKCGGEVRDEVGGGGVVFQNNLARGRQEFASGHRVVEKQSQPNHPRGAHVRTMRQDKAHGANQMRRGAHQDFALAEGFAHQAKMPALQVSQSAVDGVWWWRRRLRRRGSPDSHRKVFTPRPAASRGDSASVNPAADDGELKRIGGAWTRTFGAAGFAGKGEL